MKTNYTIQLLLIIISGIALSSCGRTHKIAEKDFYAIYSQKLGVKLEGKEDKTLIKSVAAWKGVPYKYGGQSKSGTDCSGFVGQVYNEAYNKKLHRSSKDMVKDVRFISKRKLETGDLVFFKIKSRKVSHVGIYIADNKFIHATTRRGVMVNDLDDSYYKEYFYKAGRVRM
ncbi:MAG: NlpC/P60 family protein [Bacteroidales bacterium]|nr:NlpC/P60 family protein [Bacteroidales bacterium]